MSRPKLWDNEQDIDIDQGSSSDNDNDNDLFRINQLQHGGWQTHDVKQEANKR